MPGADGTGRRVRCAGRSRWLAAALALLAAVLVVGCGSGGSKSTTSASTSATSSSSSGGSHTSPGKHHTKPKHHHPHHKPAPKLPPVGATQALTAYGSHLHVTVTQVLDPLPYKGSNVLPGTRPVGVEVRIAVISGATYDSTASGDWSLELSPKSADAAPLSVNSGVCETQLQDFESAVYGGDVRPGCVAFSLPAHAKIAAVVFAPHSNLAKAVRWR
jgi:hypothetical protein